SDADCPADPVGKPALGKRASLRRSELAVLEDHQRRDRPYIVARGRAMILIDVELDDRDLAAEFLGDLLERRGALPARTAPFSPEIRHDGGGRPQYVALEGSVGNRCSCHLFSSPRSPAFDPQK